MAKAPSKPKPARSGLINFTRIFAKISELCAWIVTLAMLALLLCAIFVPDWTLNSLRANSALVDPSLSGLGLSITIPTSILDPTSGMVIIFAAAGLICTSLLAMTFRNTYLILKTAAGQTWFAKSSTPFQKDIVRMLREIGIFLISSFIVGILALILLHLLYPAVETSLNITNLVLGFLMLCLSQYFSYGTQLEHDVAGLI